MVDSDNHEAKIQNGFKADKSTVADLFQQYRPRLKRLVLYRMHPGVSARLDASDVLQEAFLEVARRLPEYSKEPKLSLFLWFRLLTIERLAHLQRMHLGAEKRTAFRELDPQRVAITDGSIFNIASQLAGDFTSVDRNLLRDEVQQNLMDALEQMDERDREIVGMRHFEELTTQEIADALGITRSGVLKRYTRAIRRLRDVAFVNQNLENSDFIDERRSKPNR